MRYSVAAARREPRSAPSGKRLMWLVAFFVLCGLTIVGRFFQLQVLDYRTYKVLASDQHEVQASLVPRRGTIYVRDRLDNKLYPVAKDRDAWQIYAVPREMKDPPATAKEVSELLALPVEEITRKFASSTYVVLVKDAPLESIEKVRAKRMEGIGAVKGLARLYPEQGIGGQVMGFVSSPDEKNQRVGKYGIEGYFQEELAGAFGSLLEEKDAGGRRLPVGTMQLNEARDGSDIVLTIDRTIQYKACERMKAAVLEYQAESASVVIMEPNTGAILAMCAFPDFDPANYGKISDVGVLNNPMTYYQFEPGSIFKPFTLAAGLDTGKINPQTTYVDPGEEKIDDHTIRNSDKLAHGVQTMTQVLAKSLNTGTIFVERLLGKNAFRDYVQRFGFGEKTGIELNSETSGDTTPLTKKGDIFVATASFGQGISVTPVQIVAGYAALGNGGKYVKPHVVESILHPDGTKEENKMQSPRQVITPRSSRLITAMMIDVVENGHGSRAGVPGYYVAGKTGTAQIPAPNGKGYLEGVTIGTFAGYAPADNPKFVMLVKVDKPKTVTYGEASAAPVFSDMAKFLLTYLQVPPERPVKEQKPVPTVVASSTQP